MAMATATKSTNVHGLNKRRSSVDSDGGAATFKARRLSSSQAADLDNEVASIVGLASSASSPIDLTREDSESPPLPDVRSAAEKVRAIARRGIVTPAGQMAFLSGPSQSIAHLYDEAEIEDVDNNAFSSEILFAKFTAKIVGVRHYNGIIAQGEVARLQREPTNKYDRNAIKVLNLGRQMLGHIPSKNGLAAKLSPFIAENRDISVEAEVIGDRGSYDMPIEISISGPPIKQDTVAAFIADIRSCQVEVTFTAQATPSNPPGQAGTAASIPEQPGTLLKEEEVVNAKLEKLYDFSQNYADMPTMEPHRVATRLYEHQKKALWWIVQKEKIRTAADDLAVLPDQCRAKGDVGLFKIVKAHGKKYWQNVFVKTLVPLSAPPSMPRGGILADDMGLGKTLEILAAIATTGGRKPSEGPTLVVCPVSVIQSWVSQIHNHTPSLVVSVFHGPTRRYRDLDKASEKFADIVITSYSIVSAELKVNSSKLFTTKWNRLVLDEAHTIRNLRTTQTQAVFRLNVAGPKWMITGTPIQNATMDIFPLVKMIGVEPFHDEQGAALFKSRIVMPLRFSQKEGIVNLRTLVGSVTLRRVKGLEVTDRETGKKRPLLLLPTKTSRIISLEFAESRRKLYDTLYDQSKRHARILLKDKRTAFMGLLTLLARLRQLCCDASLLPSEILEQLKLGKDVVSAAQALKEAVSDLGEEQALQLLRKLQELAEDECVICMEPESDVITRCGHVFHRQCISKVMSTQSTTGGQGPCPLCRTTIRENQLLESVRQEEPISAPQTREPADAKIKYLVEYVKTTMAGNEKLVVFSSFTKFLDRAGEELRQEGISCCRLDGRMTTRQRSESMYGFEAYESTRVMLCSLKAAGVGVTLTTANHLILTDPWWNPAAEEQAIDRVYRIGQTRSVQITRLVMQSSIEENMLKLAEMKRKIYQGALGKMSAQQLRNMKWEVMDSIFDLDR